MANGFNNFRDFNLRSGSPNFGMSGNLYQDYLKNTNPLLFNQKFGGPSFTGAGAGAGIGAGAGAGTGAGAGGLGLLGKIGGAVGAAMPVIGAASSLIGGIVNFAKAIKDKRQAQQDTMRSNRLINKSIGEITKLESEELRIDNTAFDEAMRASQIASAQQIDAAQAAGPKAAQATAQAIQSGVAAQQFGLAAEQAKQIQARDEAVIQEKQNVAAQMANLYGSESQFLRERAEGLRAARQKNLAAGTAGLFGMAPALAPGVPLYGTEAYNNQFVSQAGVNNQQTG
jgi:hypothetical protein|tara:strand:- start:1068 stop:1919 length:852 start_codon:yes stop_codon:yes gene_type:complete